MWCSWRTLLREWVSLKDPRQKGPSKISLKKLPLPYGMIIKSKSIAKLLYILKCQLAHVTPVLRIRSETGLATDRVRSEVEVEVWSQCQVGDKDEGQYQSVEVEPGPCVLRGVDLA
jgi:hypothetical protein